MDHRGQVFDKTFPGFSQLNVHSWTHSSEKPFDFTICQKSFASSSSQMSQQLIHTEEQLFPCTVCDKSFSHSNGLKKTPKNTYWPDFFCLLQVYKALHQVRKLEDSHENPHREETLSLPAVCPNILLLWVSEETPNNTYWPDFLLLLQMYKVLLLVRQLEESHDSSHRRETLSMHPV